ncbi:MAG TPA: malto-oligosyltrehalose synthase [Solirubrobacteraceae bacterium]|nr:malto-oligosyltrehalose synthase [Solirubrobacteraceae bacterium]
MNAENVGPKAAPDGGAFGPGAELRATYRLQLTPDFGFASARALVPYLRDLGISHLYLSPSLQARPGSRHGYDVIDPRHVSEDLGGESELRALSGAAHDAGLGLILDFVPNHMAVDDANRYWADPSLREKFFDIEPSTGIYRRFFDVSDLAGVRQEDPEVFEETHALVFKLVRDGVIDGLRIDHPDGLADPAGYLAQLRARGVDRVWVEKILDAGERLRDWPVCGTVGYEFLNDACALFVDPAGEAPLTALWERVSGDPRTFPAYAYDARLEQVRGPFAQDVDRLLRDLPPEERPDRADLENALALLPLYRTYVDPVAGTVDPEDRRWIETSGMGAEIAAMLLLEREAPAGFVTRFQQTTPAIMAKGVEDTAFYRYCRLIALNDVGGAPSRFGITVQRFHAGCLERAERFPLNMLTTMTHDAKRSGDVRARIAALASIPDEWAERVERWFAMTDAHRSPDGAPDDVERYFLFQTLVGAWVISPDRIEEYMEKSLREAKRNTNWVEQNYDWEEAVKRFCRALYTDQTFLADFEPFAVRVAELGDRAALGQLVLKLTAPGLPDIYRGDELPFRALVDPDNRRPVDFDWHQAMLRRLMGGSPPVAQTHKMFVILRLLGLRARRPAPFVGGYEPVDAGQGACVFLRSGELVVVVALRDAPFEGTITDLPGGRWRDVLRGDECSFDSREPVARLVGDHGIAVFERL